jgi:hypothetical protein
LPQVYRPPSFSKVFCYGPLLRTIGGKLRYEENILPNLINPPPYICSVLSHLHNKLSHPPVSAKPTSQSTTITIDWDKYWNLQAGWAASFRNYIWQNGQWVELVGKYTTYGIAGPINLVKYNENGPWSPSVGYWDNVWRLHFLKPHDCPECYWNAGVQANTRVYLRKFTSANDGAGRDYYALLGESITYTEDGLNALNYGLNPVVGEPHPSNISAGFYRTMPSPGYPFPYKLSASNSGPFTTTGCANNHWFWDSGLYPQRLYGYLNLNGVHRNQFSVDTNTFGGGAPRIMLQDLNNDGNPDDMLWNAKACWLGTRTIGPYTGNAILLQFSEPHFGGVETWTLMENRGLVQVERINSGVPKVRMTICNTDGGCPSRYLEQTLVGSDGVTAYSRRCRMNDISGYEWSTGCTSW